MVSNAGVGLIDKSIGVIAIETKTDGMTNKTKPIFNSFQEYMEAEDMIFKTLQGNMETVTIGSKDIE